MACDPIMTTSQPPAGKKLETFLFKNPSQHNILLLSSFSPRPRAYFLVSIVWMCFNATSPINQLLGNEKSPREEISLLNWNVYTYILQYIYMHINRFNLIYIHTYPSMTNYKYMEKIPIISPWTRPWNYFQNLKKN